MKKLKAFTLMELLIAMIIGGIVVGISYTAYSIIYKQFLNYKSMNGKINEASLLNTLMQHDFSNASFINASGEKEITFTFQPENKIVYRFDQDYIIRQTGETRDTFFVPAENIERRFQNEKISDYTALIDAVSFEATISGEKEFFNFGKQYASDVLMEAEKK